MFISAGYYLSYFSYRFLCFSCFPHCNLDQLSRGGAVPDRRADGLANGNCLRPPPDRRRPPWEGNAPTDAPPAPRARGTGGPAARTTADLVVAAQARAAAAGVVGGGAASPPKLPRRFRFGKTARERAESTGRSTTDCWTTTSVATTSAKTLA